MTSALDLIAPDQIRRQVLVALAAVDPFTGRLVSDGLEVEAAGLTRRPIVNLSGHFVWPADGPAQPTGFTLTPKTKAYQPMQAPAPAVGQTLVKVFLQPGRAYPYPDAAILVRGRLLDTAGGAPVGGAQVWLQWRDDQAVWRNGHVSQTEADGWFAAGLVVRPPPNVDLPANAPPFSVRLAVRPGLVVRVTAPVDLDPGAQVAPAGADPAGQIAADALLPP
jgi:hypothetical protein